MNTAFDLKQRISSWREAMAEEWLTDVANLDELENHLREHFTQATTAGASAEEAFESALVSLGEVEELRREFAKRAKRLKFHWDNPPVLNVLSAWYIFWGMDAIWNARGISFLNFPYMLWVAAGLGLLCRRSFWRWYALATSAFSCAWGVKGEWDYFVGGQHMYNFYHSIFPQTTPMQWELLHVLGLFNTAVSAWAIYILTRKSISRLFSKAAPAEFPA